MKIQSISVYECIYVPKKKNNPLKSNIHKKNNKERIICTLKKKIILMIGT